jgi:hypothetical protein
MRRWGSPTHCRNTHANLNIHQSSVPQIQLIILVYEIAADESAWVRLHTQEPAERRLHLTRGRTCVTEDFLKNRETHVSGERYNHRLEGSALLRRRHVDVCGCVLGFLSFLGWYWCRTFSSRPGAADRWCIVRGQFYLLFWKSIVEKFNGIWLSCDGGYLYTIIATWVYSTMKYRIESAQHESRSKCRKTNKK